MIGNDEFKEFFEEKGYNVDIIDVDDKRPQEVWFNYSKPKKSQNKK